MAKKKLTWDELLEQMSATGSIESAWGRSSPTGMLRRECSTCWRPCRAIYPTLERIDHERL